MPWNYRIDEERRLVITTLWDKVTGAEVADHQRKLSNDPRFERDFFQFVDLADVAEIQIDRATVAELARFDLFSARSRRPVFAPNMLVSGSHACSLRSAKPTGVRRKSRYSMIARKLCSGSALNRSIDHTVNRKRRGQNRIGQVRSRCLPVGAAVCGGLLHLPR